jgi:hypothetical protein
MFGHNRPQPSPPNARRFDGRMVFVPEGQHDSSQARSALQFGYLERGTRGDLCLVGHTANPWPEVAQKS